MKLPVCLIAAAAVSVTACASGRDEPAEPVATAGTAAVDPLDAFGITANNAFFYYADVERAARFYTEVLGVQVAADYGFAKILRIADTSYLTLVDAAQGMHAADEPKTTAIALVTDQLDQWYAHVQAHEVPLRGPFTPTPGRPHDGFVAIDPEGYYLEFERFNAHAENESLMPVLDALPVVPASPAAAGGHVPAPGLGFKATVLWLYYNDLSAVQRFYEDRLGFDLIVDQGWARIYRTSRSGFFGLVDQSRGMHRATEQKGVTASFFTNRLDDWFAYVQRTGAFSLRSDAVNDDAEGRYRAFVGYDPEGYYLEFDVFLPHPLNTDLLAALPAP